MKIRPSKKFLNFINGKASLARLKLIVFAISKPDILLIYVLNKLRAYRFSGISNNNCY